MVDRFTTTLEKASTFNIDNNYELGYNSSFRADPNSTLTPARWRLNVCSLTNDILENKVAPMDFVMGQLQKYLNSERYGFNGDLIITMAKYNASINSMIVFRGIKCTLLHGIVQVCGGFNLSENNESFHNFLIRSKPIIDIKDEYGRTALCIAVWNLSKPIPNLNEVNVIRCLIEYGFNPFIEYRGSTIFDKLSKTCTMIKNQQQHIMHRLRQNAIRRQRRARLNGAVNQDNDQIKTTSKAIQVLLDTYDKISYFRDRVEAIQSSLKILVDKGIIIDDIANTIQDCIGISNYAKCLKPKQIIKPDKTLQQRINKLANKPRWR